MQFLKKNIKKIVILLVVISILGFIYYRYQSNKNQDANVFNPQKDELVTPVKKDIKEEITLAGFVDASSKADLRFQTAGQLQWIGVKVGDKVKKFQTVATLNRDQLKKQLEISFNNYKSQLSQFDDTQDEYKKEKDNLTLTDEMKRILLRSQASLDNSVINYELNDLAIKYASLASPIEGVVTSIDTPNAGVNITPANSIFIINPKSILFKSQIDQEDVVKIKVGDKTSINLDSYPDKTFDSKVTYISFTPVAGQSSTVYEVHFELPQDNDNLQYRLGMDGDARIELKESKDALTIPIDAVQEENNQTFVLVKSEGNNLTKRTIKTGIESDNDIEVLNGLSENDQVVIKK